MDYYQHLLNGKTREKESAREREHRALVAEARLAKSNHRPRIVLSFRLRLPRHKPEPSCATSPEFA